MQRFKSIILPMQGKNKSNLHWLYNEANNLNHSEEEKKFSYGSLRFWFCGTGFHNPEKLLLLVSIPIPVIETEIKTNDIPIQSFLLSVLSPVINNLNSEYLNEAKSAREKARFEAQKVDELMLRRSGIRYDFAQKCVVMTIHFSVPLVNALSVNAKAAVRALKDILKHIESAMKELDMKKLHEYVMCYNRQMQIRTYLKNHDLCAFVANGSILPREKGTSKPMKDAIPFCSPKELEVAIPLESGKILVGMGLKRGVTVITGGGYSGKSTLLDAIESGINNHIPGDGREYVITEDSALKIYAEDGRPVHNIDISPFFRYLPQAKSITNFSTPHASGSVSQAANIIEAICGGSKVLLIDEDKSATNFMICDQNMRKIVKDEPIIPFTDRVRELSCDKKVSTILVIGGSSEYLTCADCVILMDNYVVKDITKKVKELNLPKNNPVLAKASWTESRRLLSRQTTQPFLYFRQVKTENERKIILDDYTADITLLTSIRTGDQMNTLACVMERILNEKNIDHEELIKIITNMLDHVFHDKSFEPRTLLADRVPRWYEEIRPLDVFCCVNRMRGVSFIEKLDRGRIK